MSYSSHSFRKYIVRYSKSFLPNSKKIRRIDSNDQSPSNLIWNNQNRTSVLVSSNFSTFSTSTKRNEDEEGEKGEEDEKDEEDEEDEEDEVVRIINNHLVTYSSDLLENIKDKKLIVLSPGGVQGFYMLGICKYLRDHYNLDNFIFSGASAGAWNSVFLAMKETNDRGESNTDLFLTHALDLYKECSSFAEYQLKLKDFLLHRYTDEDFDFKRVFIGVTHVEHFYKKKTYIYSDFRSLSDCLECCLSSSHVPILTSKGIFKKYRKKLSFDGGFSEYPYIDILTPELYITPNFFEDYKTCEQLTQDCHNRQQKEYFEFLKKYTKDNNKSSNISNNSSNKQQQQQQQQQQLRNAIKKKFETTEKPLSNKELYELVLQEYIHTEPIIGGIDPFLDKVREKLHQNLETSNYCEIKESKENHQHTKHTFSSKNQPEHEEHEEHEENKNKQLFRRITNYRTWNPRKLYLRGYKDAENKAYHHFRSIFTKKIIINKKNENENVNENENATQNK